MTKVTLRYEIVFEKDIKEITNDSLINFEGECENKIYPTKPKSLKLCKSLIHYKTKKN